MSRADDLIRAFEARNAGALAEESDQRLHARVICFTTVEILRAFLQLALARACAALRLPHDVRDALQAEFTADEASGMMVPAITFKRDIELPCDSMLIARTMAQFFKMIRREWISELDQGTSDDVGFQQVAEWLSRHPESKEKFAKRLRKWCG